MTDDNTSITTVSDDEIGSWEDRTPARPVASTILFRGLEISPRGACQIARQERPNLASCSTALRCR